MVTIQLNDSTASALAAQANAAGLSLEDYLDRLSAQSNPVVPPNLRGAQLDALLDAEATPGPAYQGTYSRADIYLDHN